jgi:2-desacetyl-2-hydroxyethyl bacteriochlorophyllide A dehydrogenase
MKTKALIFTKANEFAIKELTLDNPGDSDIVVKTLVSAISPGTERWTLLGKHLGTQFPCCPGYHRIGVVERRGKNVKEFEEGDIVYGTGNRWMEKDIVSLWGAHAGMSVSDPAGYSFLASQNPGKLELECLAFTILTGVANRGVRACDIKPGQRVLIIGAGFLGICAARLAALKGGQPVLLEVDQARSEFAGKIAGTVMNPLEPDAEDKLKAVAPDGFDILYDTVGNAATTDKMVRLMRRGGLILMQAQYFDKEKCAVDLDQIKIRELTIKTTCGIDAQDFRDTVDNIRARRIGTASMITHRFSSGDILKGYELLKSPAEFSMGIVFHWNGF